MPDRFFSDIADIMAGRPIAEEAAPYAIDLVEGWSRRPERDIHGVEIWQAPSGEYVGVASPALKARLRSRRNRRAVADGRPREGAVLTAAGRT